MSQAIGNCFNSTATSFSEMCTGAVQYSPEAARTVLAGLGTLKTCIWQVGGSVFSFGATLLSNAITLLKASASRISEVAQPALSVIAAFVAANSGTIAVGACCMVVGALLYASLESMDPQPSAAIPAETPAETADSI